MIEPKIQTSIIRVTEFARNLKKSTKNTIIILHAYQLNHPSKTIIFRNPNKPTSPWYVDVMELYNAGFIQEHLLVSREAKILRKEIDELTERVAELEDK